MKHTPVRIHLRPAESEAQPVIVELETAPVHGVAQTARVDTRAYSVALRAAAMGTLPSGAQGGRIVLSIDGRTLPAWVVRHGGALWVHADGAVWRLERILPARARRVGVGPTASGGTTQTGAAQGGRLLAAMPGRVLDLLCVTGDVVEAGQTLALLEAMKMELRLTAPASGVVAAVHVAPGAIVERGALLLELSPLP